VDVTGSPPVLGSGAGACRQCGELLGQAGQDLGLELVVREAAARLGLHQPGLAQHLQMVGQVGLPGPGLLDKVRGAERLAGQQAHDLQAERITQAPDHINID
jgi:hypothetical protein